MTDQRFYVEPVKAADIKAGDEVLSGNIVRRVVDDRTQHHQGAATIWLGDFSDPECVALFEAHGIWRVAAAPPVGVDEDDREWVIRWDHRVRLHTIVGPVDGRQMEGLVVVPKSRKWSVVVVEDAREAGRRLYHRWLGSSTCVRAAYYDSMNRADRENWERLAVEGNAASSAAPGVTREGLIESAVSNLDPEDVRIGLVGYRLTDDQVRKIVTKVVAAALAVSPAPTEGPDDA